MWTGGVWLEKFDLRTNVNDSCVDRRHHRGAHVDPEKLRFASAEERAPPQQGLGVLLFGQKNKDEEKDYSENRSSEPNLDLDAILKDTTIQPSVQHKNGGIGIDRLFRNFVHR